MKILVTGVAGFVGSKIAARGLREGVEVVGIDSLSDYYDARVKARKIKDLVGRGLRFVEGDLMHLDLDAALQGVSTVFHQAGQPGVRSSWGREFQIYLEANIGATQRLLEAATRAQRLQSFVYASSSSVYGDAESYPTTEETLPRPLSPYGVTKLAAEHLCRLYAKNFDVPTVSLRYFTVYGPGQRPDMAFTRFCKSAVTGEPITLFGDGTQIRDFTYVDDVVEANWLAASVTTAPGSVYNVAGGSNVSMNEVIALLQAMTPRPLQVVRSSVVQGDVKRTSGSTENITRDLGWVPSVSLEVGLRRQYEWAAETFGPAE